MVPSPQFDTWHRDKQAKFWEDIGARYRAAFPPKYANFDETIGKFYRLLFTGGRLLGDNPYFPDGSGYIIIGKVKDAI